MAAATVGEGMGGPLVGAGGTPNLHNLLGCLNPFPPPPSFSPISIQSPPAVACPVSAAPVAAALGLTLSTFEAPPAGLAPQPSPPPPPAPPLPPPLSGQLEEDATFDLPNDWQKMIVIRKNGASAVPNSASQRKSDVYLIAPDGTKLRSNVELVRYITETRMRINPIHVNFERNVNTMNVSRATAKLIEDIKALGCCSDEAACAKVAVETPNRRRRYHSYRRLPSSKRKKDGGGGSGGGGTVMPTRPPFQFPAKHLDYLQRQWDKVPVPTESQVRYMARQLKVERRDVQDWFDRQYLATVRPLRKLGLTEAALQGAMPDPPPVEDGNFTIENDNAEEDNYEVVVYDDIEEAFDWMT